MPSTRLKPYRNKRSPGTTPEPFGRVQIPKTGKLFVIQMHQARQLHWDLRLEIGGVLRSWAVPKGPSRDTRDKRFAALVEDHPLDYADFEGHIPEGNYGAGHVIVWDKGTWQPLNDIEEGFKKGKLLFALNGFKLHGRWTLVRLKNKSASGKKTEGKEWLLIKESDQWAQEAAPYSDESIFSGLTLAELAAPGRKVRSLVTAAGRVSGVKSRHGLLQSKPMLASAGEAFNGKDWLFELKYDGYRIMIERAAGQTAVLRSRNGHDLTASFPEIALSAQRLPWDQFVLDGELVVHNANGVPDFSLLQQRAKLTGALQVARAAIESACHYYAFDLLQIADSDLRGVPLGKRKTLLQKLLPAHGAIRYSEHVAAKGRQTYAAAVALGLEGIVAKRADSRYKAGRSSAWVKVRSRRTGDFVIAGWSANRNNPADIGSLALAEYRSGELHSVGSVGSGLNADLRQTLQGKFAGLASIAAPANVATRSKSVQWLEPLLVCEVGFKEYTRTGNLRHPVFIRLREDKPPRECAGMFDAPTRIEIEPAPEPEVIVTHPEKIYFPEKALRKQDLVNYYEQIAPWMLTYLRDRPIVLTRYPDGIHGKSFYQRDAPDFVPDWIQRETLWSEGAEREVRYFIVQSRAALKYLANLGTLPIHLWHSRITNLEHPDWCVLDLDPKTAPFSDVVRLANAIGELADDLALPAYPKTSGASGLHVLIPLARQLTHSHARTLGELIARVIVSRYPDIATIARSLRSRHGRVYIDYLQNGQGQLLAAPFSARAEPAASVSMPLRWHEVNRRLANENFHLSNAVRRLRRLREDPMHTILDDEPDLQRALKRLAVIMRQSGTDDG